jgi:hypothetical protein
MSTKIEARRFSGKQGTWPAYEMACNAVFAAAKIKKYLCKKEDRPSGEGELEKWKDAQQDIYGHFTLTCDGPANTTVLSVDPDFENVGNVT